MAVAGSQDPRQYSTSGSGLGGSSGIGGVWSPTPSTGSGQPPAPVNATDQDGSNLPGVVTINPLDPAATDLDPLSQLFNGLRQSLVGGNEETAQGQNSRERSLFAQAPGVGELGRAAFGKVADVLGGVGEVIGGATAGVGGTLERIHMDGGQDEDINARYNAIPEEFRKMYDDILAQDNGLLGTGHFSTDMHYKTVALKAWEKDQAFENPSFAAGSMQAPGSLAMALNMMFDFFGEVLPQGAALQFSTLETPGGMDTEGNWQDRLDVIRSVGRGQLAFNEDQGLLGTGILKGDPTTGLNDIEALVFAKTESGEWTDDEARDFLAFSGQSFGHTAIANLGGGLAWDPSNIASFGALGLAKLGAKGLQAVQKLQKATLAVTEAQANLDKALEAAKLARVGGTGAENLSTARKAVKTAEAIRDDAEEAMKAFREYRSSGEAIRKANIIGRSIEGSEATGKALRGIGHLYGTLAGTNLGRVAKTARYMVDPLHAIDLGRPGNARMVDLLADAVPMNVVDTLGPQHYKNILNRTLQTDNTRQAYDKLTEDIATASSNLAREGLMDLFRQTQLAGVLGEKLMKVLPGDVMETAMASIKQKDLMRWLRFNALKHVQVETWDNVAHETLARQLASANYGKSFEEWMELLPKLGKEEKSLYKFAAYGRANTELLDLADNLGPDVAAKLPLPAGRLTLLARNTLTRVGGESLLTQLTKAKSTKKRLAIIAEWQERYPSLRYVTIDPVDLEGSVDKFIMNLEENLDRLPMQMLDDEIDALGETGDRMRSIAGTYSIGFKPEDRFLWGMERDAGTGLYRAAGAVWADHVGAGARPYRPARYTRMNIIGHPIPDVPGLRVPVKLVDHMDTAARMMRSQVSATMVTESARKRFVAMASNELRDRGVTEQVADSWFERIASYTREHQGYSGPRGMSGDDLYGAIREKGLIPQALLSGDKRLAPEDVMLLVLKAYDGDIRYIGLTQKLSSRAKVIASLGGSNNFAGQIAEHAWPTMKFRLNPIFQVQEKFEPWVLNAQRGISFATGVDMSASDRALEGLLQKMTDNSLVRMGDIDQYEYSAGVLLAQAAKKTALAQGTALGRIRGLGHMLGDVQGMKRLNMLRTFKAGLGRELKAAWDEAQPGQWDAMKDAADLRARRVLSDDDFALQMVSENAYANDIFVQRVIGMGGKGRDTAHFANAVKTGVWYAPTHFGEVKGLELDHMAASLRITNRNGDDITDLKALRETLATEPDAMKKVEDALAQLGASPDYIRRVRNALDFSWTGFWKTAEKRFGLTGEESRALQDMMAEAASLRNMTPVDFMSQVFSPTIIDGTEGVLGHIEGTVRILRDARAAGRKVKPREAKIAESRTRLAGKEGVSTREDLVRQLSKTFSAHLDPSAKRALLQEFNPDIRQAVLDGKLKLDMAEVNQMWDELSENALADRILGYMDGKPPSHAADELDDTRGVVELRNAATKYMRDKGVTPLGGRPHFRRDADMDAHYEQGAAHFRDLPDVPYERTARVPNSRTIGRAKPALKPKPDAVDDATYRAYESFVVDVFDQFDYITRPKAKGGLGLKVTVTRKDPYTPDAAGRAAMLKDIKAGKLKVYGDDSDHALMTNEQNVMFRAVHDVFGHAAEGFEFGPRGELNAAATHARMFSNEGRPAMLTETHGQTAYVNYSDDIIGGTPGTSPESFPLDPLDPVGDFETRYPFELPEYQRTGDPDQPQVAYVELQGEDEFGITGRPQQYGYTQRVGAGVRSLPPEQQLAILQPVADLFDEFPNLRVHHIDVISHSEPFNIIDDDVITGIGGEASFAVTWGAERDESVIILNRDWFERQGGWDVNDPKSTLIDTHNQGTRMQDEFTDHVTYRKGPRNTDLGTPHNRGSAGSGALDIQSVMRHETFHAFDIHRRPSYLLQDAKGNYVRDGKGRPVWDNKANRPEHQAYSDLIDELMKHPGRKQLSEYSYKGSADFVAELGSIATDPDLVLDRLLPDLRDMVEQFQKFLRDTGEWVPRKGSGPASPFEGMTVRQANELKRGSVYAPQKGGLLPQPYLDEFMDRFVGRSKHIESNPDVARTAQMFGKWTENVIGNGLLRGKDSQYSELLGDVAGIPTGQAVPYNYTEGAVTALAQRAMAEKWEDAFRLQYFKQERTMFERTLNHPMFGMYPASYMWGKILPELVQFIAQRPFGNRTGAALYSMMDVQASIALRREFDPEFDAYIEEAGHSQVMSFLGFMMPTLPWEVGAAAPPIMRSLADQGLTQAGKTPEDGEDISLVDPALDTIKRLSPLTTTVPWAGRAIDEAIGGKDPDEVAKDERDHAKLVRAAELEPTMARVMQELQEALR